MRKSNKKVVKNNVKKRRSTRLNGNSKTFKCGQDEVVKWLYHFSSSSMTENTSGKKELHIRSSLLYKEYFNFYSSTNNNLNASPYMSSSSSLSYMLRRQFVVVLINLIDKNQCPYHISYTEYGRGKSDYLFRFDFNVIHTEQDRDHGNDSIADTSNKSQQIDSHPEERDQVVGSKLRVPTIAVNGNDRQNKEPDNVSPTVIEGSNGVGSESIDTSNSIDTDGNDNHHCMSRGEAILRQNKWHSPETMKIFFGLLSIDEIEYIQNDDVDQETVVKQRLREELQKVQMGWLTPHGYKDVIDHDTSGLRVEDIFLIQCRCKYLAIAIETILVHYHHKSWCEICNLAIEKIESFHLSKETEVDDSSYISHRIRTRKTLSKLIRNYFMSGNRFPNPAYVREGKKRLPPIFEDNPDFRSAFEQFCDDNLGDLTGAKACTYLKSIALPQLLLQRKQELGDRIGEQYTMDDMLNEYRLTKVSKSTCYLWMEKLGYSCKDATKTCFTDNHEKEENVQYRCTYVRTYLESEFWCARWIQIPMDKYRQYEMDEIEFRCKGYEFTYDHSQKDYIEFHVDDVPDSLYEDLVAPIPHGGYCSVRMPEGTKQMIIFGQDESIFNQYSLRKKVWVKKDGKRAMLPKGEGQGVMISAFMSREFGMGMDMTKQQLDNANRLRQRAENIEYSDKVAAQKVHGNSKKAPLTKSPFIRYLHYGANCEGYWSYDNMIIQAEDCIDCLKSMFEDRYEYTFLFDHSNGHDRMRPDGLNARRVSKQFGGKQPKMRNSKIENESYLGPYERVLNVGDVQSMTFNDTDIGPIYMTEQQRMLRKYDKLLGKKMKHCQKMS